MEFVFFTPSYKNAIGFGGATFGFAGNEDENMALAKTFEEDIHGVCITGSYNEVLKKTPDGNWQAAIVLLGNAGNENEFIRKLSKKVNAPLIGGAGALCPKTGEGALITGHNNAAVFLISDGRFDIRTESENVHYDIISEHELTFSGRYVNTIDGKNALEWYQQKQLEFKLPNTDFEHLTLSDKNGINAHFSIRDGMLFAGRDLEETMLLRFCPADKSQERIATFYNDENAIVFGCAGLKQTLSLPIKTNALGLFMFGEVCTVNSISNFGNLMLSKIVFNKKA